VSLNRVPIPSPNYSSRGGAGVRLIVLHTAEGARSIESLGSYFQGDVDASSHAGADDKPNTVGIYVDRPSKAWTQASCNPYCVSIELCGFAAWTPAEWDAHPEMVANAGRWIGEEAAAFGIPLRILSAGEAQGGAAGVCQHVDLGAAGGGHWDCGSGFPMARALEIAGGAAPSSPPPASSAPPAPAGTAPPFPGHNLVNFTAGLGTATWQAQMVARGWALEVDDLYGDVSEGVCRAFQQEKGLGVDGIVGPITWDAAWALPVT
jgi:Putative peptidoglycan binding domain/N-acetylmuramoyl-L-alanine amidase